MEHSYIVNPFADVICTICQYVVKVNITRTLFVALHEHERKNGNHPVPHDEVQRKVIATQLTAQLKQVTLCVRSLHNDDITLANEYLLQYLSHPAEPFMFCTIYEVLVKDWKIRKMRNKHFTSCNEAK